jgi:hypothetical protein
MAHRLGWMCAHFKSAPTPGLRGWATPVGADGAGFPDLILVRDRRVLAAELKSQKGLVSEKQRVWLERLQAAGVDTWVWRPSDLDLIEQELR